MVRAMSEASGECLPAAETLRRLNEAGRSPSERDVARWCAEADGAIARQAYNGLRMLEAEDLSVLSEAERVELCALCAHWQAHLLADSR